MNTEIMQKIIEAYRKYVLMLELGITRHDLSNHAFIKQRADIDDLKSQLSEAGEEKKWDDVEKEWKEMQRPLDEPINL